MKPKKILILRTLESREGERKLKQHAFVPKYDSNLRCVRNISLCGMIFAVDEWNKAKFFTEMLREGSEKLDKENICKRCLLLINKNK